ncbi:Actin-related protein 2/3 complex subunit 5 [Hanseniaspora uvarum DSM 2768]|nr:Actin-related protein 2/3 complex subunit 5 [Hanseniaspora uvarum DSM 2768]GMM39496.1 Arc15 protein [Hanseniaspora uvarum]
MEDWRKIDIDALDASTRNKRITNDEIKETLVSKGIIHNYSNDELAGLISEVEGKTYAKDFNGLIVDIIAKYPVYSADDLELKLKFLRAVQTALVSCKNIEPIINALSDDEANILIKYCYKIMSIKEFQSNGHYIVNWVDKIIAKFGQGIILKYITDRRTI